MNGLAKIAVDNETWKSIGDAFTPQGYEEIEKSTKRQTARDLGLAGSIMGGLATLPSGSPARILSGLGIGGGLGAGIGYGLGSNYQTKEPIYSSEQLNQQQELSERYPNAVKDYIRNMD